MCAHALEGECLPSPKSKPDEKAKSLLQQSETSNATSVPFPWKTKSVEANSTLFSESVKGLCTECHGCSGKSDGEFLYDCDLMDDYQCSKYYKKDRSGNTRMGIEEREGLYMFFVGRLDAARNMPGGKHGLKCQTDPEPCVGCKKYSTCAGPYLETEPVLIKKGDVASYTWRSSGDVDSYEVFVGLYSETCGLVDFQFQRGARQPFKTFELFSPKTDKYYMKFLLASYDGTGGGMVGADMEVKDVKQTKATVPRVFEVNAKCMVRASEYMGLPIAPDPKGKCKTCLKKANKRCLKPDGTFPVPDPPEKEE